ncbi:MAG: sensor histidine kinase [Roseiarcus sp.]
MTSLGRSALVWLTLLLAAAGVGAFLVAYRSAQGEADDLLDGQLRLIALNVGERAPAPIGAAKGVAPEDEVAIVVIGPNCERVATANARDMPILGSHGYGAVVFAGESWRAFLVHVEERDVQVAQRMGMRDEIARSSALQAGLPIVILIPLAWLFASLGLARLMDRTRALAAHAAERGIDAHEAVPLAQTPAELAPLVEAMNGLVLGLREALDKQIRFVADAAHELRTPLAALRIQAENLEHCPPDELAKQLAALRLGTERAGRVAEQLLRLARVDELTRPPAEVVDLADLVSRCVADLTLAAESNGVDLGVAGLDACAVRGDRADLAALFGNLIDNAVRYTDRGGVIDVSLTAGQGEFLVAVIDTGPGVAEEALPRLFERFFRAAPLDSEGSGLGLAIAAAVARRHRFVVSVENRRDRSGSRASVRGPRLG